MDQGLIVAAPVRGQRGFTIIELMIVVVIVAVLAAVVVPTFFRAARKTQGSSEISPMFAEIGIREEQYKVDNNVYLDIAAACPLAPSPAGVASTLCSGVDWLALRVNPAETTLHCSYQITAGNAVGTNNPGGFVFTSPATNWYYVLATCDLDADGTNFSTYFMSSVDPAIQKLNEGN